MVIHWDRGRNVSSIDGGNKHDVEGGKSCCDYKVVSKVPTQDKCLPCGAIMLMYCWMLMWICLKKKKRELDTAAERMTSVAGAGRESWKDGGKPMGFVAKV